MADSRPEPDPASLPTERLSWGDGLVVEVKDHRLGDVAPWKACTGCPKRARCGEGIHAVRLSHTGVLRPCMDRPDLGVDLRAASTSGGMVATTLPMSRSSTGGMSVSPRVQGLLARPEHPMAPGDDGRVEGSAGGSRPGAKTLRRRPPKGMAPLTVNFTATGTDSAGGTIAAYAWTFGTGATSALQNPSYIYTTPGTYTVSVEAVNECGSSNDIYQGQQGDGEDEFEQELIDSMLAPIEDPSSPAAVVPLLIRGPAEALQAVRHVKIDRAFEESQVARSDRVLERILQGLDVPKDVVTGLANVKYCLTPDAEAFTRRAGWTAYTDILEGDQILTLNPENGQVEFQAPSEVTAFEYDSKEDGPMTKIESEGHRSISTRDHRWPVWAFDSETTGRQGEVEILTSADLVAGDIIIRPETPTDDAPLNGVMIGEGDITQVEYKGDVWCPTTPNGTWLARDKETGTIFFTGNTNSITIDETLYKTHIEPLLLLLSDALTKVYLHPALRDMEFSEDEIRKVVLWYDPSGINTRSDRAADADAGYDKFAISADAWRSAHNFGDDDAPTEEEIAFRMLTGKGIITPEMTEALLALYAPDVIAKMRAAAQASSPAPVPDEVEQMLDGGTPAPGAPAAPGADMAPPPGLAEPGGGISEPAATDADPAEAPTEEEFEDADPPEEVPTAPAP